MRKNIITLAGLLLGVPAATVIAMSGLASAETTTANSLSYEFDNGNFAAPPYWTLQKNAAALDTTFHNYGYADAGVVVDLGPASGFTGITVTGSGVADNVWFSDGSDAYTPGSYGTPNFSYGFDNGNGTFYMATGHFAGHDVTAATLASYYAGYEAHAWAGVVYTGGSTPVSGSVFAVNGQATGNRVISLTPNSDGTLTVVVH